MTWPPRARIIVANMTVVLAVRMDVVPTRSSGRSRKKVMVQKMKHVIPKLVVSAQCPWGSLEG